MASQQEGKEARLAPDRDGSSAESSGKDLAAAIVPDRARGFDRAAEERVLRKIDRFLIPWMWFGYGFVYYDKVRDGILGTKGEGIAEK